MTSPGQGVGCIALGRESKRLRDGLAARRLSLCEQRRAAGGGAAVCCVAQGRAQPGGGRFDWGAAVVPEPGRAQPQRGVAPTGDFAGRGVVVHTADCRNYQELQHNDKEGRGVVLGWHQDVEGEYRVELKIEVEQQRGIIASLANKISSLDGSIESIKVEERDAKSSSIHIFLAVNNRIHLARVIRRIRVLKSVVKVERVKR